MTRHGLFLHASYQLKLLQTHFTLLNGGVQATSALDNASERIVQQALDRLAKVSDACYPCFACSTFSEYEYYMEGCNMQS